MKIERIDHICFAVHDLEQTKKRYKDDFGLMPDVEYIAESEKIKVARYYIGEVAVEFMESTAPDGDVAKFVRWKGEGFFLISYRVDNIDSAMDELRSKNIDLIDHEPRTLFGNRYAFIHNPKELGGVLTELLDGEFDMGKE
jgi:methylmalonyl-CoA/ethylmalonyl-CoA epimerase